MKVLTVVNSLDIGGIEKTLLSCVPFLKSKGIKVIVCVYNKDGALEKEFVKLGVEILKIKKTKSILLDLFQTYSLLKKHQIDIVHSRFGFSSGGFVLAAFFYGIPSIVSYHNTHPGYRSNYILRTVTNISVKLHKWITYNFATKIVGHSKTNLKTNYHDWDSNNKFRLIYNGINFSSFNDYKSKSYDEFSKNYHGKEVLLHIGSFRDQKNHEFLLKVFSKIDPIKNNIFLILIGDGPKKLNLLKLVEDLRIEKNVIFTGAVKDLGKFLSVSDILFFPSKQEGFGNVIAEAQYMNIPICGSDISSMDESIYEDYKKYRFNPYNTEEATFKLKKILKDNKAKILELSKIRAAEFVNNNFAIDRMANELSNLYIEVKKDSVKQNKNG